MGRKWLAALLRRWADKLDPPPPPVVAMFSPAQAASLRAEPGLSQVLVDGAVVLDGVSVRDGAQTFLGYTKLQPGSRIEWLHDGVRQDLWAR